MASSAKPVWSSARALTGSAGPLRSSRSFDPTSPDPPLTIMMYGRMREGASPVLNAVSLFLMIASALLALMLLRRPATSGSG